MPAIKICLVEDQDLVRKSLGIVLGMEEDIEVLGTAENGALGLELCERLLPDVVLMDINMPVMDGIAAAREIKKRWPNMRVVMLTTFAEVDTVANALSAGAEGYVLKDIDPQNLASVIRLIHAGETMIPQGLAKQLFERLSIPAASQYEPSEIGGSATGLRSKLIKEYGITKRELEVLQLLADGLKNSEIAARLYLSEGSVRNYISSVYSKLNVPNRASAIRIFHMGE